MASQTRSASPSRELFGFEVHERLGQGAASDIYLASDPATGQVYALKHVVRSEDCQTRILEQLAVEYDVSRRFTHPGLRRSYQLKERRTMLRKVMEAALVMELVDGIGLDVHPQLPPAQLLDCLIQTANALAAMHALGYVHCDLKPNNLLLQPDGQIKVIDFGQACRIRTVKERIQGTADFIAPEQVRRQPITVRTDVYNFGATAYRLLTGKSVPTLYTVKQNGGSFLVPGLIPPPGELRPEVPGSLSTLVMECVRMQPHARPSGMNELAYRLDLVRRAMT